MAFYVKMSTAPGECAKEAMRQGLGVSAAVLLGYIVPKHDPGSSWPGSSTHRAIASTDVNGIE